MVSVSSLIFWTTYAFIVYIASFLLITLLAKEKREFKLKEWKEWPTITVIIPAYNEEKTIGKTIKSVLNLDYPKDKIKVVVVNDGSKDKTLEVAKKFEKDGVIVLDQENKGKAAALNNGLKLVNTQFFACLDADSFVRKDALKKMLAYFVNNNVAAVCPLMKVNKPKNLLQKLQWLEYILYAFIKKIFAMINSVHVTPGPFSVYRTSVIKKLGGFDEKSIVEDQEIAWHLQRNNYQIMQCMDGVVLTNAPKSLKELYRQRKRWYKGSMLTILKYKDMVFNPKYGDFGMFQAPSLVIGSFLLPLLAVAMFFRYVAYPVFETLKKWWVVKFDVLPSLKESLTMFNLKTNLLLYDYAKLFVMMVVVAINIYWFKRAYKEAGEKINLVHIVPLFLFFIAYYILLSFMWVGALISLMRHGKSDGKW